MKKFITLFAILSTLFLSGFSQEDEPSGSRFGVTMDFVNRYIWRGSDYGNAPHIQPGIKFTPGSFIAGAWGSYSFSGNFQEADLFASYTLPFGLGLGFTDYYFPSGSYDSTYFSKGHYFELNTTLTKGGFSAGFNIMLATLAKKNDIYIEMGYTIKSIQIFAGAGNEAYTSDGTFMVCNTGIKVSKDLSLSENCSLPVFGAVIFNPQKQQIHLVAGITF